MKFASRIEKVPPYLFVGISRKIAEKRAQGIDVISFGIGDPDIPTPENVVEKLRETALDSPNHRYPETDGLPSFGRQSRTGTSARFGISVHPDKETLPLIGAKEGIGHAALCFIEPATSRWCRIQATRSIRWARGSPAASATGCRCSRRTAGCPT